MDIAKLLLIEEGNKERAYYDSLMIPTIGIGIRLGPKNTPLEAYSYLRISPYIAKAMCLEHADKMRRKITERMPLFEKLNLPRQSILISMAFQMGVEGLFGFENMIGAINNSDWAAVYVHGKDSLWASESQTPERAERHMMTMLLGDWSQYEI